MALGLGRRKRLDWRGPLSLSNDTLVPYAK